VCKATNKSFTGPEKGRRHIADIAVLHFIKETCPKGVAVTCKVVQMKATETAQSLRRTNDKDGEK
jgi:hypothetical protein